MSDAVSKLKVMFEADSSALDKAFDSADKKASGLTGVFGKVTGALGSIGLAGMGISAISGAVGGVVGSFGELIGAAEGVGDAAARIGLVWDQEMIGIVEDNATIANSLGLTKAAYLDQVGALGQLATSLGVNSDAAADMAMGLTELAPKLAAYAGVEGTVASDALEKALMGKTKGLAALGIAITDADQQSAALALGLGTEAAKWTEAEKAQINYAAVLDKTGAAQSAWADNQGDVEVSMQRVSAAIEDAKAALGEKLLPILAPVAEAFASMLPGAIDKAVSAFGPFLDALSNLADGDYWAFFGEIGAALESLTGITGIEEKFDAIGKAVQGVMDAMSNLADGDVWAFFGEAGAAIEELTGIAGLEDIFDDIGSALQGFIDLLPVAVDWINQIVEKLGGWSTVIGVVATALAAFAIITTVVGWVSSLMAAWAALGAGITAAGGIVGAIIAVLGGPLTIAIAAIAAIVAGLALAWKNDWGGMREKVAEIVGWIQANVVPAIQAAFGQVQAVLGNLVAWWQANGAEVIAVVSGIVTFIVQQFEFLFNIISGIVKAGIALITGDWAGLGQAVGSIIGNMVAAWISMFQGIIAAVSAVFRGLWPAVKSALSAGVTGVTSWLKGQGDEMGKMTLDGLIAGIKAGAARVLKAITDLAGGLVSGFMDAIDAHSPSKVFAELGEWITAGLASGIADDSSKVKAINAILSIVNAITAVASALPDAMKKLAEATIPDDATIEKMSSQFDRMFDIVEKFVKRLSVRSVMLGVTGSSDDAPDAVKNLLRMYGLDPASLLTNSDVTNVGKLLDATQKVIGTWATIVDTINKIADVKPVAAGAFEMIEGVVDKLIDSAERLAKRFESTALVGLTDMAASVKAAADILSTGAALDLSEAAEVTAEQMRIAGANLALAGQWAWAMVTDWLRVAGDDKTRKAWVDSLKDFSDTVGAATSILKAGDVGDLSEIVEVTADQLRILGANIALAGQWAWALVTDWLKTAPDHAARQKWVEDMKDFADTIGAAVDIAKASVIGELKSEIIIDIDAMRDVLIYVRDILAPAVEEIVKAWGRASEEAKAATEKMQSFAGWIGAAVNIAKASVVGELHANILINTDTMRAILVWMRDAFAPMIEEIAMAWGQTAEAAKPISEKMKAFGDWIGAAVDIAKASVVGELHANILVNFEVMKSILVWMRDAFVPMIQEIVDAWGETAESAKPLAEKMKAFASIIGAAASIAKAADVGDLAKVTSPADMGARLAAVRDNVKALFAMIGEIAADIGVEEAKARADLAEAIGRASSAMGDFSGGIGGLMELAQSKLFGSTAGRPGMGHTQRTRTNRADFFAQQLGDTVKRAVGAVQDALNGITLTVDDAKVAALAALGDAFGKIADGLTKLAEAKMPDAKQLAEISAALLGAQGLGGGVGGTGGGGAAGGVTLNLSNATLNMPPINASVTVTSTPTIMIGTRTIETLATIIEQKIAEKFVLGGGTGSPITPLPGTP